MVAVGVTGSIGVWAAASVCAGVGSAVEVRVGVGWGVAAARPPNIQPTVSRSRIPKKGRINGFSISISLYIIVRKMFFSQPDAF